MAKLISKSRVAFNTLESTGKAYFLSKEESLDIRMRIGIGMEVAKAESKQREIQSRVLASTFEIGMKEG